MGGGGTHDKPCIAAGLVAVPPAHRHYQPSQTSYFPLTLVRMVFEALLQAEWPSISNKHLSSPPSLIAAYACSGKFIPGWRRRTYCLVRLLRKERHIPFLPLEKFCVCLVEQEAEGKGSILLLCHLYHMNRQVWNDFAWDFYLPFPPYLPFSICFVNNFVYILFCVCVCVAGT